MVEEQLISVLTEKDIVAMLTTSNSYINVNESVIECSFQCLEVVNATFVGVGKRVPIACLSSITKKGVKQTVGKRAQAGFRLESSYKGHSKRCR